MLSFLMPPSLTLTFSIWVSTFYYSSARPAEAQLPEVQPWHIENLVTFGDSYSDIASSNGGTAWPVYAAGYANVSLFPFAASGATCSNNLTSRPFPSVMEGQLPSFNQAREEEALKAINSDNTLYFLWIGTNDVGDDGLLSGGSEASIIDVAGCMTGWVKKMYWGGARNFLIQNMLPLQQTPMYAPDSYRNRDQISNGRNDTQRAVFVNELVLSGNAMTRLMLDALLPSLPEAHVGVMDAHGLFTDILSNPDNYLNGSAPINTNGSFHACQNEGEACTGNSESDRDSYLWYDPLHPSEQAGRVVAQQVSEVIRTSENRWLTWLR